jgi:dihydroorotate dehydrogenase
MPDQPATIFDPSKSFDDNVDHGPFGRPSNEVYQNKGNPTYNFLGHKLYSPFGIGAGSLPTSRHVQYGFERGFDVICYKTQRSVPFPCNMFPNVVYVDVDGDLTIEKARKPLIGHLSSDKPVQKLTITNSFGNPSRGPDFWEEDMKQAVSAQGKGQLLIASVVGTAQNGFSPQDYYQDFADTAAIAIKTGVSVIELNLSCPNVADEGVVCYTYDAVIDIARRTKEKIGDIPIIAKLGYFTPAQQELLEKIVVDSSKYLSAYSVINTIQAAVVDETGKQLLPGPGRLRAGVCGRAIRWAGLEMVTRLTELRQKHNLTYEIIGIGGVSTPADFQKYRTAGAEIVQAVTAPMWNDKLAEQIKATL